MGKYNFCYYPICLILLITFQGCNKVTQVPAPSNTITTAETFDNEASATAAIAGMYVRFGTPGFGNATIYPGMSADELHLFGGSSPFETNTITASSGQADNLFWDGFYFNIYQANAAIEGLKGSDKIPVLLNEQLTAEAKFVRAYDFFYLVNYYGASPVPTTTQYHINDTLRRSEEMEVYQRIIFDLKEAKLSLPSDYRLANGKRIRANKDCASALLARAYLYTHQWDSAESEASKVIDNSDLYSLNTCNDVFLANSTEAILQLETPDVFPYATFEALQIIPYDHSSPPSFFITSELLSAFEPGDLRRNSWVDSTNYNGTIYYYPLKYKIGVGTQGNVKENYMILRLAEQYLIRAEARGNNNNLTGAIEDLNVIRERAMLNRLPATLNMNEVLDAIEQERRIELFAELSHRWFDLKRLGKADLVLGALKPTWTPEAKLYPIPLHELLTDANLFQNPGY